MPAVPAPSESGKRTVDKIYHGGLKGTWRTAKRFKFGKSEAHDESKYPTALLGIENGDCDGPATHMSSGLGAFPPPNGSLTGNSADMHGLGSNALGDDFVIVEASDAAGSDVPFHPGAGERTITTAATTRSHPVADLARSLEDDLEDDDNSEYIFINYPKRSARRERDPLKTHSLSDSWHAGVRISPMPAPSKPRRFIRTMHDVTESILSRNTPKRRDDPSSEPDHTEFKDDKNDRKRKQGPADCVMM